MRGNHTTTTESPDLVAGMRLLDLTKHHGFQFQRIAPGPDGPLWGVRETDDWQDTIYLGGSGLPTRAAPSGAASPP